VTFSNIGRPSAGSIFLVKASTWQGGEREGAEWEEKGGGRLKGRGKFVKKRLGERSS